MKYKLLHIILFLTLSYSLNAQVNLESFLNSISHLDETDQINILKDSCWVNRDKNPVLALEYGNLAKKIISKSFYFHMRSEIHNYIGIVHQKKGNLDSAYIYYNLALNEAKENNDSSQIAYSLNNLSGYYFSKAFYANGLEKGLNAFKIFKKLGDSRGVAYSLNDIGEIYLKQGNLKKAYQNFQQSADIRFKNNDLRGYVTSLLNLALTEYETGENMSAKQTFLKAIKFSDQVDYEVGKSKAYKGLCDIYYDENFLDSAKQLILKALNIDEKFKNEIGVIHSLNKLGEIEYKERDFVNAKKNILLALEKNLKVGDRTEQMESYHLLQEIYLINGEFSEAYKFSEKYNSIKDSIYSSENNNRIADLETRLASEQFELENAKLQNDLDIKKQNNQFLIIIGAITIVFIIVIGYKYRSERKISSELKKSNASLQKLFAIVGHDLKNPAGSNLNMLEMLKQDYDKLDHSERKQLLSSSYKTSKRLAGMLEDIFKWGEVNREEMKVTIEEFNLIEIVVPIIELLQTLAEDKNITLEYSNTNIKVKSDKKMLSLVIRNLIGNAIKFTPNGGKVTIGDYVTEDLYFISVKDTGIGIEEERVKNLFEIDKVKSTHGTSNEIGSGLGLIISNECVKKCGGEIKVYSIIGKGTEFLIKFPKAVN